MLKDVSLYPYNWSQMCHMLGIRNELILQRELQTRNVFKKDKRRRIKKEENIKQARLSTCT